MDDLTAGERVAFRMQLNAGALEEYRRRHDEIWPELLNLLREAGVYDYSIFVDPETLSLFGVLRMRSDGDRASLGNNRVMRRWWQYMAGLMETHPDDRPVETALPSVFYFPG